MEPLLGMYKMQRYQYSKKLLKNIEEFSMAETQEEMLFIAKKGAGIRMMLEHAEEQIKKLEL